MTGLRATKGFDLNPWRFVMGVGEVVLSRCFGSSLAKGMAGNTMAVNTMVVNTTHPAFGLLPRLRATHTPLLDNTLDLRACLAAF